MAKTFEELECWQFAISLDKEVYAFIMSSMIKTDFALKDQMLRSVGSISDNIAEGFEIGETRNSYSFYLLQKDLVVN